MMIKTKFFHFSFFNFFISFFLLLPILLSTNLLGDPSINAPVCLTPGNQTKPAIIDNGHSKAIIVWEDERNATTGSDIYAQCVDIHGETFWTIDGIVICNADLDQYSPQIVSDGNGGAIIGWLDLRGGAGQKDIYIQRVDSNGTTLWTENGVAVCNLGEVYTYFDMESDGEGGVILTWEDGRLGETPSNIFAQHFNSEGENLWADNGIVVCDTSANFYPKLVSNGLGGAIITWSDGRSPIGETNYDIYAQNLDGNGVCQWTHNGVAVTRADYGQQKPEITTDMAGGAIIVWYDFRWQNGLWTQRVNSFGNTLWIADDIAIDSVAGDVVEIISDNTGGAFYMWPDRRFIIDQTTDIYGQHITASGLRLWEVQGIPVCDEGGYQGRPQCVNDGGDGVIVTWYDNRDNDIKANDIFAQRLNSGGDKMWLPEGVCISKAENAQESCEIALDTLSGVYITWCDYRKYTENGSDIYMQGVDFDGNLYDVPISISDYFSKNIPATIELYQNYPNPFNPSTTIEFFIPSRGYVKLEIYNTLGEKVKTLIAQDLNAGKHKVNWNGSKYQSGIYFCRLKTDGFTQNKKLILLK
jgi:hypothetical protein